MKAVTVEISWAFLHDLLCLPKGVRLVGVRQNFQQQEQQRFEVVLEADHLKEVQPYEVLPWGKVEVRTEWCNAEERIHVVEGRVENYKS